MWNNVDRRSRTLEENIKSTKQEKKSDKNKKTKKTLKVVGYVLCAIMLIAIIVTAAFVIKLNVLPTPLLVIILLIGLVVTGIFAMCQKWVIPGVITKALAVITTLVLVLACVYMNVTYNALSKMTGVSTQISNIHVYVLADDSAQTLEDTKDYQFGILQSLDRENTDKVVADINKELKQDISISEYDNVLGLVDALYNGETKAIILNSAYISFVTDTAGYEDFESRIRSVSSQEIVEEIKTKDKEKEKVTSYDGDEVIAVYISGNDCEGVPEVNGNSDVNIILIANLKTRQILLVSTPRDYYVPLSISNGVNDKLTHAGAYGIDVSVETLEMLYEVEIDDYVKVNFTGFIEIVDALGGVNVYSEYDFYTEDIHYNVGYNQLNGYQALMFARNRGAFSDGDRQRGKNQMAVIEAIIKEMATSDMLKNYADVLDAISGSMITSMSYEEISNLVKFQLNNMQSWEVLKYSVNGYDSANTTYSLGGTAYVMEPDYATVEQAKEYINQMYEGKKITISE